METIICIVVATAIIAAAIRVRNRGRSVDESRPWNRDRDNEEGEQ